MKLRFASFLFTRKSSRLQVKVYILYPTFKEEGRLSIKGRRVSYFLHQCKQMPCIFSEMKQDIRILHEEANPLLQFLYSYEWIKA